LKNFVIGFLSLELLIALVVLFGDLSISGIQILGNQMPDTLGSQFLMINWMLTGFIGIFVAAVVVAILSRILCRIFGIKTQ
jgi:uncharacterized membrane protein YgaE (UPF0421/DUF939 family)